MGSRTIEPTPEAAIVVDASEAVAEVLAADGGIGMSAGFVVASYVERGLPVPVLHAHSVDISTIAAVWPESRRGNPNVKAFVAFLEELEPRLHRPSPAPPWPAQATA